MELRPRVLLSLQRALTGAVTPDLRAVSVELAGQSVLGRAIFESATDFHRDLIGAVETEVLADFEDDFRFELRIVELPPSERLEFGQQETVAFARYEALG